jgi:hypothetical protein
MQRTNLWHLRRRSIPRWVRHRSDDPETVMKPTSDRRLDLLLAVAGALESAQPVTIGTMFRSPAIRAGDKIVAFLGHHERLIVKVSAERAAALIAEGEAEAVTMGARTMREWVALLPADNDDETLVRWIPRVREAFHYVSSL